MPNIDIDPVIVDSIKLKITAIFEDFAVELKTASHSVAALEVKNLTTQVTVKSAYTDVSLNLEDIIVTDRNPNTVHSKVSVVHELKKSYNNLVS